MSIINSMLLVDQPDVVSHKLLVDEKKISSTYQVVSITLESGINKIPSARILVANCSANPEDQPVINNEEFLPGKKMEIQLGYHDTTETVFKGIIVTTSHKVNDQCAELTIDCRDETVKMTITRKGQNYRETTDHDIIKQLLDDNQIADLDIVETGIEHEQLVQANVTDWDFMISRIDVNGSYCVIDNGKVFVKKPDLQAASVLSLTYGVNILEFHADMDSRTQSQIVKTMTWDFDEQKVREIESDEFEISEDENKENENRSSNGVSVSSLASVMSKPHHMVLPYMSDQEQKAVSDAKKIRQVLSKIKGRVKYQGITIAKPGDFILLNEVGEPFNGKAFVSAIQHEYAGGDWTTEATLGWDEKFFAESTNPQHPASGTGQISAVQGLQTAIVSSIVDPNGQYRVKIRLPLVHENDEGVFARIATLDAGKDRGTFFRPEIDDEVLVGFMNDDPRHPVILGMLHSSKKTSPLEPEEVNNKKGYISRTGSQLIFDDGKKSIVIKTPGNRVVELDDDTGTITIKDAGGNKIIMEDNGITIEAIKDLNIKANKSISINAPKISIKADAELNLEGSGTTSVKSGGITEIKGSMVKIN